jgi:peptide/nickel transport system substrate-binding protein
MHALSANDAHSPRWRRWAQLLLVPVLLASIVAACGSDDDGGESQPAGGGATTTEAADDGTPVEGGSATILLFSEVGTLDPVKMTASGGSDGQRGFALYGGLFVTDPETHEAVPLLAESFEANDDFTVWTLKIKPDVVMSDGSPYDAEAVKANWDRAKDIANRSPSLTTLLPVSEIAVTDPLTVTVTLSAPNAHFDKAIARVGANYIASAEALAAETDFTSTAIGAGPYLLKEWLRDDRMVLERNPDWKGGEGPYLDTITYRVVGDEDQRVDTFATGAADLFYTATPASVIRAEDEVDDAYYASVDVTQGQALTFNNTIPPFDDLRMRKAFVQGVDWQAMAEVVFGEGAEAPYNFTLEGTQWYDPEAEIAGYDPEAAQALIDEYVAENGGGTVTINYTAFQQSLDQARAQFIQTSLNQLDKVNVNVEVGDSPTNIQKVLAAEYMVSSWGFPTLDPDPGLYVTVHSQSFNNYSKYSNPEVDRLLEEARVLTDNDERKDLYDQVWRILAEDLPYLPYVKTTNGFVSSPKVRGAAVIWDGIIRLDLLWKAS